MDPQQLLITSLAKGLNGKQVDTVIMACVVSSLKHGIPIFPIKLDSLDHLLPMLKDADKPHLYIAGGMFHFNALYFPSEKFPVPRIYFIKSIYLDQVGQLLRKIQAQRIKLSIVDDRNFSKLIQEKCYDDRYERWNALWKEKMQPFKGLAEGRHTNTILEKSFYLHTESCLFCDNQPPGMQTTTLMIEDTAIMLGLKLCALHLNESKKNESLLSYIIKKFNIEIPSCLDSLESLSSAEIINISLSHIQEKLMCKIEKLSDNTITALRKSGFRIIFRLDKLDNYAYTIQDPKRKNIIRIDSANHHNIDYGPDHIHINLSKKYKNQVMPSFTYGIAYADLKVIQRLVEEAELKYELN